MTFAPHHRIIASGTFAAAGGVTGEIFTFSLASNDSLTDQALATAVVSPLETWFHSGPSDAGKAHISNWATLTEVRVESVNALGGVDSSWAVSANAVGDAAASGAPAICAFAITLETDEMDSHGRRVRGRFFPPNQAWYNAGNPLSAGTDMGLNIAQSGAVLVTDLNSAGASICVASTTNGGINAAVTSISADNVVDTIRRRKNHAVGTRGTQTLPYTP